MVRRRYSRRSSTLTVLSVILIAGECPPVAMVLGEIPDAVGVKLNEPASAPRLIDSISRPI